MSSRDSKWSSVELEKTASKLSSGKGSARTSATCASMCSVRAAAAFTTAGDRSMPTTLGTALGNDRQDAARDGLVEEVRLEHASGPVGKPRAGEARVDGVAVTPPEDLGAPVEPEPDEIVPFGGLGHRRETWSGRTFADSDAYGSCLSDVERPGVPPDGGHHGPVARSARQGGKHRLDHFGLVERPEARADDDGDPREPVHLLLHELVVGRAASETRGQDRLDERHELVADEVHPLGGQLLVAADAAQVPSQPELPDRAAAGTVLEHAVVVDLDVEHQLGTAREQRRQVQGADRLACRPAAAARAGRRRACRAAGGRRRQPWAGRRRHRRGRARSSSNGRRPSRPTGRLSPPSPRSAARRRSAAPCL